MLKQFVGWLNKAIFVQAVKEEEKKMASWVEAERAKEVAERARRDRIAAETKRNLTESVKYPQQAVGRALRTPSKPPVTVVREIPARRPIPARSYVTETVTTETVNDDFATNLLLGAVIASTFEDERVYVDPVGGQYFAPRETICAPEPTYVEPERTYCAPEPSYSAPEPSYSSPSYDPSPSYSDSSSSSSSSSDW